MIFLNLYYVLVLRAGLLQFLIFALLLYTEYPCNYGLEISFGRPFFILTFVDQFILSKCFAEFMIPIAFLKKLGG